MEGTHKPVHVLPERVLQPEQVSAVAVGDEGLAHVLRVPDTGHQVVSGQAGSNLNL